MKAKEKIDPFDRLFRLFGDAFEKIFGNKFTVRHWKIIRIPLWVLFILPLCLCHNYFLGWALVFYLFVLFCAEFYIKDQKRFD
jgi:hypothetical protein